MKCFGVLAILAMFIGALAACGGAAVDESLLPTLVPTYPPGRLPAASSISAAAPEPATPSPPPTVEPSATPELTATPLPTATVEPTATATLTPEPTAAPAATEPSTVVEPAIPAVTNTAEVDTSAAVTAALPAQTSTGADAIPATGASSAPASAGADIPGADTPGVDAAFADLLPGLAAALAVADPVRGQQLTVQNACTACHALDPALVMPGPSWHGLADRAGQRVAGQSAAYYLYNSIIHPNDYVVEGFLAGIMLSTYQDTLNERDLADIMAYLLTLTASQ